MMALNTRYAASTLSCSTTRCRLDDELDDVRADLDEVRAALRSLEDRQLGVERSIRLVREDGGTVGPTRWQAASSGSNNDLELWELPALSAAARAACRSTTMSAPRGQPPVEGSECLGDLVPQGIPGKDLVAANAIAIGLAMALAPAGLEHERLSTRVGSKSPLNAPSPSSPRGRPRPPAARTSRPRAPSSA